MLLMLHGNHLLIATASFISDPRKQKKDDALATKLAFVEKEQARYQCL